MVEQPRDLEEDTDIGPTFPVGSHVEAVEEARQESLRQPASRRIATGQTPRNNAQD